jgi:hypothetical protein
MHFASSEIRHALFLSIPMLVMLLLALLRWRLWKQNAAISETLRRND